MKFVFYWENITATRICVGLCHKCKSHIMNETDRNYNCMNRKCSIINHNEPTLYELNGELCND